MTSKGLTMEQRKALGVSRALKALALRKNGMLLREIGNHFSVGVERARQMVAKGERIMRHPSRINLSVEDVVKRRNVSED